MSKKLKLSIIIMVVVAIFSIVSWGFIFNPMGSRSGLTSEITKISNNLGHLQDTATQLNSFASVQNSRIEGLSDSLQRGLENASNKINGVDKKYDDKTNTIQTDLTTATSQIDDLSGQLSSQASQLADQIGVISILNKDFTSLNEDVNTNLTSLASQINDTNENVDTLTSSVNSNLSSLTTSISTNFNGFLVTTSVSSNSTAGGTGKISISVTDSVSQNVAFKVEFRPTTNMVQTGVLEDVMKTLYNAPPITLNETTKTGTVVRGDYSVYWGGTQYSLGSVVFITQETSLAAGTTVKTLYFTYKSGTAPSFEILVTTLFGTALTSTGASLSTW